MSPISCLLLSVPLTLLGLPRPGPRRLHFEFLEGLGHGDELGSDGGESLGREETLPEREATRIADRTLQIACPHVLDEQEASGAAGSERGRYILDLPL